MSPQTLAFLTAVAGAIAAGLRAVVRTKLTPDRLAHCADIARIAVRAAEQMGQDLGPLLPADDNVGAAKLAYASNVVAAGARRLGFKLSEDEVLAFVHQALRELKTQ